MTINERLKYLRKHELNITQSDMADILGLQRSSYSMVESGHRKLMGNHIKVIVTHFNVNESWLRYGEGEIFDTNPLKTIFIETFESLDFPLQKYFLKIMQDYISLTQDD